MSPDHQASVLRGIWRAALKPAERRIVDEARKTGCLPRYANYRTVAKLKEMQVIYFSGGRYWVSDEQFWRKGA